MSEFKSDRNVLITSAGRRGYLVKYFKDATTGKVHVGNSETNVPAFFYADKSVVTPVIYDEIYIPFLLDYCNKNKVSLIVSAFDIDVYMLSKNKNKFKENGINLVVPEENESRICNDKWLTSNFCEQNKILTPNTYIDIDVAIEDIKEGKLNYPLIIKPRWGMGSIGIYEADNLQELKVLHAKCQKRIRDSYLKYESQMDASKSVIIQEKIFSDEYGLDIFNDLKGTYLSHVVKKKLGMRAGETDAAVTVKNNNLDALAKKISGLIKHAGNLDVDVLVKGDKVFLLEMNPRFGGGYPFSHLSGVDFPRAILKLLDSIPLEDELDIKYYDRVIQKDIGFVIYE